MLLFGEYDPISILAIGLVLLFGMGWHEYAHAFVADWWGDPTPRQLGRLTPNPLVHINWVGWLMFLVLGFGILGSVPVNPHLMRDSRWGSFWTSFAGPLSNLIQAIIFGILMRVVMISFPQIAFSPDWVSLFAFKVLLYGVYFNVLLFFFNLLPFYPIDGWRMVLALLPGTGINWKSIPAFIRENVPPLARFLNQPAYKWNEWAQISQYALLFMFIISFAVRDFSPFNLLIGTPTTRLSTLLLGL